MLLKVCLPGEKRHLKQISTPRTEVTVHKYMLGILRCRVALGTVA